jgi:hypothetical protein
MMTKPKTGVDVLREALRVWVRSPASRDLGIGVAALEAFSMGTANLPPVIQRRTWRQRLRNFE